MGRGLAVGRHQLIAAAEASSAGWTLNCPAGRTVIFSSGGRTLDLAEVLATDAVRRQGGQIESLPLTRRVKSLDDLRALRAERQADEAIVILDAATAAKLGVADIDPAMYEGVAVSVTEGAFAARPVLPEVPVLLADSYGPLFARSLLRGEVREADFAHFARIARTEAFKDAFERMVRVVAPAAAREHLATLESGKLDLVAVADLISGIGHDSTARYEAKRAFLRAVVRLVDESATA